MYGKFFASTFTGSMFGCGPVVFAVWAYVIANTHDSQVELNPGLLAAILGCSQEEIERAFTFLCSPDERSRSHEEEGRRLVREGQFSYRVVNHAPYREMRNEDDRRAYNREKQRESRARRRAAALVNDKSALSAHTEAEAEAEAEEEKKDTRVGKPRGNGATKPESHKPELLGAEWQPPADLVDALALKHGVDPGRIRQMVPEFRVYWRTGKGKGKRRNAAGWSRSFSSRIDDQAKSDVLYAGAGSAPNASGPQEPIKWAE